jgi:steroid delta-isomerase-like uncharacterized protein
MSSESNISLYRKLIEEAFNQHRLGVIETAFADDYQGHDPAYPRRGPGGAKGFAKLFHEAFTEFHYDIEEVVAQGDLVAARWTVHGRHTGPFLGIAPTERLVTISGMSFNRFREGKIVEGWIHWDVHGLLVQLGLARPIV